MLTFWEEAQRLNAQNYSFENEMLYRICREHPVLTSQEVLAGKISMIGRIYAASPERRAYGRFAVKDSGITCSEDYTPDGKKADTLPVWPARWFGDGQGGFFSEIARQLQGFAGDFSAEMEKLRRKDFRYDFSEGDFDCLVRGIQLVLALNRALGAATERVDGAPAAIVLPNGERYAVDAKFQISFCSKFLHFHLPHHVFIIDSYSNNGGKWLFPHHKEKLCYLRGHAVNGHDMLEDAWKKSYDRWKTELKKSCHASDEASAVKKDVLKEDDYLSHALHAYALCCLCKREGILPSPQRKLCATSHIRSYPRLADCILMNLSNTASPDSRYGDVIENYKALVPQNGGV